MSFTNIAPALQTPTLVINDSQLSMDIDCPSDMDLPTLHDSETEHLDSHLGAAQQNNDTLRALSNLNSCSESNAETKQQSLEEPFSETQCAAEETRIRLAKTTEQTRSTSPHIADTKVCTSHPISPSPRSTDHTSPVGGEAELESEAESEQDIGTKLRYLRFQLQRGLLPMDGLPKAEKMKAMSLCLSQLEGLINPSTGILHATRIPKLLKSIKKRDNIPMNDKFDFRGRAARLLEKWGPSLEKADPTKQRINNHGAGINAVTDDQKLASVPNPQQLLNNKIKTSATSLTKDSPPKMSVKSEQPTSGSNIEPGVAPANDNSPPTPPPSPALQKPFKSTLEHLVIDLTGDEVELPHQSTNQRNTGSDIAKGTQKIKSSSPSSKNSEPVSTPVWQDHASPKSDSVKPHNKKRKRLDAIDEKKTQASDLAKSHSKKRKRHYAINEKKTMASTPKPSVEMHNETKALNREKRQRTTPWKHLSNEILWMNESVTNSNRITKLAEKVIDIIIKRGTRLREELKENETETELELVKTIMDVSIESKKHLIAWGAQDERVTEEWTPS